MNRKNALTLLITVIMITLTGYSDGAVLGTIDFENNGSIGGHVDDIRLAISYPLPWDPRSISLSQNISQDDIGRTFRKLNSTRYVYNSFTYLLTNGIDNLLWLSDPSIGWLFGTSFFEGAELESSLINGIGEGVDLQGYKIRGISLTVNQIFFNQYGSDMFPRTDYFYDITYTIHGSPRFKPPKTIPEQLTATPEPATIFLLAIGAAFLRKKR